MTTIYIVTAEKQYSSSKVIAAFDDEDGALKLKDILDAVEPRWTIFVQPVELTKAPPKPFTVKISNTPPEVLWNGTPAKVKADGDDYVAEFPAGGIIPGPRAYTVGDRGAEITSRVAGGKPEDFYSPPDADNPNGI